MKRTGSALLAAVACAFFSIAAQAHEEHCHQKGSDGKLVDVKGVTTESACKAQGGEWRDHHAHCHKSTANGAHADYAAKTEKECAAAGGKWEDHGHEKAKK
jgi:hypothetical protein